MGVNKDDLIKIKIKIKNKSFVGKRYENMWLIVGIVFCLIAPILIYSITGINLYESNSFRESFCYIELSGGDVVGGGVSTLYYIRICLASILFNLIVLLFLMNYNKVSGSLGNKVLIGAS